MPESTREGRRALDIEGILVLLAGVAAALLIAAAPTIVVGEVTAPDFRAAIPALAVCAFGLSFVRPVWAALGVGLPYPLFTSTQDSNLWPIAVAIVFMWSMPPAVLGAFGGWILRRFVTQRIPVAMILVAVGLVGTFRPLLLTSGQIPGNETYALSRLTTIVEAQRDYRARDSNGLYACNFNDLDQPLEKRPREPRLAPLSSYQDEGWANGYHFTLTCTDGTREMFVLRAYPEIPNEDGRRPTGLTEYCTTQTGEMLSLPAIPRGYCWENGTPLSPR